MYICNVIHYYIFLLTLSVALIFAPFSHRYWTMSLWPSIAAHINAIHPFYRMTYNKIYTIVNIIVHSIWVQSIYYMYIHRYNVHTYITVLLSLTPLLALTFAPFSHRYWTMSLWPPPAAYINAVYPYYRIIYNTMTYNSEYYSTFNMTTKYIIYVYT